MSYLTEFPDYDSTPLMLDWKGASTWADTSWHNDVCPSAESDDLIPGYQVRVFSDYEQSDEREMKGLPRFAVILYSDGDEHLCDLLATDSALEVENLILAIESVFEKLPSYVRPWYKSGNTKG